jgi:hypothetical protein
MRTACHNALLLCIVSTLVGTQLVTAQEASTGLDLRATMTAQAVASNELTEAPRLGSPLAVGSRSVIYPTLKINENWFITGAMQLSTRPYFFADLSTSGYGAKGALLQSTLNYFRSFKTGTLLVRAGQMPTAFGSFVLRYDDADNALVDLPIEYGYDYSPVSILGVVGAQVDATYGKWDTRVQFANSSPANPRSLFAHDQYGNWVGGVGYTIRQGFRAGISAYRGPYLDRQSQYFYSGEANPNKLPATGVGVDINWAHGHTSAQGEVQQFVMPYHAIPMFRESVGYGELKQVLSPRWYIAVRDGFSSTNGSGTAQAVETAVGFRPDRFQLIKIAYEYEHYSTGTQRNDNMLAIQFITMLHRSVARE